MEHGSTVLPRDKRGKHGSKNNFDRAMTRKRKFPFDFRSRVNIEYEIPVIKDYNRTYVPRFCGENTKCR